MTGENDSLGMTAESAHPVLHKLFHIKRYEKPDEARMVRSKQNIMRRIRHESQSKRKSISDLIEINYPWLFAEPKYGVALLFVAFAGLQYLGVNARQAANSQTGIYMPDGQFAAYEQPAASVSNSISYPELPENIRLFGDVPQNQKTEMVEYLQRK